jgi:hypothetical protein
MIHPVTMNVGSPEREMLRAVMRGDGVDVAAYQSAFVQKQPRQARAKQLRASMLGPLLAGVKDAYLRFVPE